MNIFRFSVDTQTSLRYPSLELSDSEREDLPVENHDPEAQTQTIKRASHFRMVFDQTLITHDVIKYSYRGCGTVEAPFAVEFLPNDERNPMMFRLWIKYAITLIATIEALAVAYVSSAYTGGIDQIGEEFQVGHVVNNLGISLFVLGFALGPLIWGPLSELYGRQVVFIVTFLFLTLFNAAAAGAQNITTLLVLRFLAGSFGASILTISAGVKSDLFSSAQRGEVPFFGIGPYLGPALGPVCGGFLGEAAGWRWNLASMAIVTGVVWIIGSLTVPETYAPLILRRRAAKLTRLLGKVYISVLEVESGPKSAMKEIKSALVRPWILLFRELIVFIASVYTAIVFGTLYMTFAAFPIVYQRERGWSLGMAGLPFLSMVIGIILAMVYLFFDNARYVNALKESNCLSLPEARLPPVIIGSICLPISLFWFAWTNHPFLHWSISVVSLSVFGFGMGLIFLGIIAYLVDSYVVYSASVLAANGVLRSLFGATSPLFTIDMYNRLGIQWASSVPAFLALACVPFPFLMYKYGTVIRLKGKYAAKAAYKLEQLSVGALHRKGSVEMLAPKGQQ